MEILISFLIIAGAAFGAIAAIGAIRLPDGLSRMHAATKAGSFGAALILLACALHFADWIVAIEALLIIFFFYITAPIAAHLLGRVACRSRASDSKSSASGPAQ